MKKTVMIALIGSLALASCNKDAAGMSKELAFKAMLTSDATYKSSTGTAKYADLSSNDRATTLLAAGLKANTSYLAHYHKMGTADATDPCKSNGAVVGGTIGAAMTSDANGALTLKGLQAISALTDAKYINIHEASDLSIVPLCAPL